MIAILFALKVRGAILVGILASTIVGLITGMVKFQGVVSAPPSIAPTFLQLQIPNILVDPKMISVIFIFIFLDLFDTVGTLVGVGEQGGFMVDGKLPRARQALLSDAVATSAGALLGTSTVTSYIESASGNLRRGTHRFNQYRDSSSDAARPILQSTNQDGRGRSSCR